MSFSLAGTASRLFDAAKLRMRATEYGVSFDITGNCAKLAEEWGWRANEKSENYSSDWVKLVVKSLVTLACKFKCLEDVESCLIRLRLRESI